MRIQLVTGILLLLALSGCKILVPVGQGGKVVTSSGSYVCYAGEVCEIDVVDFLFDETFTAIPDAGYIFKNWKKKPMGRGFCAGPKQRYGPCRLFTSFIRSYPKLIAVLESEQVFYLEPVFEKNTGGNKNASVCFNEELYFQGTRLITTYANNKAKAGEMILDSIVDGPTMFEGNSVTQSTVENELPGFVPGLNLNFQQKVYFSVNGKNKTATNYGMEEEPSVQNPTGTKMTIIPPTISKFDLAVGQMYTRNFRLLFEINGKPELSTEQELTVTTTYHGIETVSVPAGRFRACRFLDETVTMDADGKKYESLSLMWIGVGNGVRIRSIAGGTDSFLSFAEINGQPLL